MSGKEGSVTSINKADPPFWRTASFLFVASVIYCAPLFASLENWGREDWDQFTFRYETPRVALLRDHVLPTWNPQALILLGGTTRVAPQ